MDNYGVKTSAKGNVNNKSNISFTSKYPMAKLDRTNKVSFQNINLTFLNDTPAPGVGTSNSTLVYQFAHDYNYISSHWMMGTITGGSNNYPYIEDEVALLSSIFADSQATLIVKVNATNVYLYVNKTNLSGFGNPTVAGVVISLRLYVFVEDLLGS